MNLQQIKSLFTVNLLYANPQVTQRQREKNKAKNLTRSLLIQYGLVSLIMLPIFGLMMLAIDFPKYPGFFTFYCALFALMTFSQALSAILNIFYESKDFRDYLPLPFESINIFIAKFLVVIFVIFPYLMPLLVLFLLTGFRANGILGILIGLIGFLLFALLFLTLSVWLITFLVQSKLFQRYKKISQTILLLISMVGIFVGIMYLNNSQTTISSTGHLVDRTTFIPFMPFWKWLVEPFSFCSFLSFVLFLALLIVLYYVFKLRIVPKMFQILLEENTKTRVIQKRKSNKTRSFASQLRIYNLGLIKNPTLWIQVLTGSFIFPLAMIPGLLSSGLNLSQLDLKYFAIFPIIGISLALLTINNSSLSSMIISLDRENFNYFKSLPMNLSFYFRVKFHFVFIIQLILDIILSLIIAILLKVPLLFLIGLLIGNAVGVYLTSLHYFVRDWHLLNLNWTTITQLFTRGAGGFRVFIIFFVTILGAGSLIGGAVALIMFIPAPLIVNLSILVLLVIPVTLAFRFYQKSFWKKL
ncbi:hypothetical protein [Lactococcus lactis]|uniref:hypothetical protein n=1 Tax=Lactococcus lactis TaxID=1358 RepID=UPI000760B647|nr:hypothetical protein [Lactococcus lactis]KWT46682.1 ABC transporter permease [Lactococcus lactis]MCT0061081.1 ABC transporter permease [Lactococcus lactis subsp. lactis]MCT0137472.1 ABC transporter permease [Lactococcus lactis subsp. lactis]